MASMVGNPQNPQHSPNIMKLGRRMDSQRWPPKYSQHSVHSVSRPEQLTTISSQSIFRGISLGFVNGWLLHKFQEAGRVNISNLFSVFRSVCHTSDLPSPCATKHWTICTRELNLRNKKKIGISSSKVSAIQGTQTKIGTRRLRLLQLRQNYRTLT